MLQFVRNQNHTRPFENEKQNNSGIVRKLTSVGLLTGRCQCCRAYEAHRILLVLYTCHVLILILLKLKFRKYPSIHTKYPTLPFYNIIIIFDTVVTQKQNIEHKKTMISTGLPYLQFSMNSQGFFFPGEINMASIRRR